MRLLPALLLSVVSTFAVAQTAGSASATSAKFSKLCEDFIHETLALSPSTASEAGYHQHIDPRTGKTIALDALLDDVSPAGMAEQRRVYVQWRQRFRTEVPKASLNAEDAADWQLIDDQIASNLLELDRIQNYRHNPTVYVELIGNALFQPLTDDFAAQNVRLQDVLSRIAAIPTFLGQARAQLLDADPIFVQVAADENGGNVDLIKSTVADAVKSDPQLKARFDQVAPPAIAALNSFSQWLNADLAKRKTDRTWRLGKELYAEKFRLVMETPVTPDQVLAEAEAALKSTRAEMLQLA